GVSAQPALRPWFAPEEIILLFGGKAGESDTGASPAQPCRREQTKARTMASSQRQRSNRGLASVAPCSFVVQFFAAQSIGGAV
ncbi:MAG: hypothetical protein KJ044_16620, partial [Planctomycetes bacterium]|nr:hypothetical protein [Planctomycetota bacterium]